MNKQERLLSKLKGLYEQIGENNTLFFDFVHNECIQDNEEFDEISNQLDNAIENINNVREITKIEIENVNRFNEIVEELEELINNSGNLDEINSLRNDLGDSLEIIKASQLILKDGYQEFQDRYDELTE